MKPFPNTKLPHRPPNKPRNGALKRTSMAQAVSVALMAGFAAESVHAQQLEEVIVTATKRAESVMDVSTLKEDLGKTSDARFQGERGELGDYGQRLLAAPGMFSGWSGPEDVSLCVETTCR